MARVASVALADPPPPPGYADSVQRAYDLIKGASPQEIVPANAAVRVLIDGTGRTQPEILSDLLTRPPRYDDARARLAALLAVLEQPATTSDPVISQQRLRDVMAMSRYDPLHRPPSLIDRFNQWVSDRVADILRLLFGNASGAQPAVIWLYVVGLAVLAVVVFLFARASRGRFTQAAGLLGDGPRPAADHFAEADRLAARGDRVAAIRALCAGVAATLEGERSWDASPRTVREIFQRAPDFAGLRPLLVPFEAAVYGGREVDRATYDRAALAAAAYRRPVEAAA